MTTEVRILEVFLHTSGQPPWAENDSPNYWRRQGESALAELIEDGFRIEWATPGDGGTAVYTLVKETAPAEPINENAEILFSLHEGIDEQECSCVRVVNAACKLHGIEGCTVESYDIPSWLAQEVLDRREAALRQTAEDGPDSVFITRYAP